MSDVKFGRLSQVAMAALCLGLTSCAAAPHVANPNEIVVGVAGPMSGSISKFGLEERRGVELAVDDINAAGGILGKQLHLEIGDDQCDPTKAVAFARDLVTEKASLVVGHFCSGSSIPAAPIYAANHIVQITASSTSPRLTNDGASQGWTTLFRVISPDDRQGVFAANWIAKKYPQGKIAVLDDGGTYGRGISDRFRETLRADGITPIYSASYRQGGSDFADIIAGLQKSQPEFVYIGGYHNDFALIIRQARAAGLRASFIGPDSLNTSQFASMAGSAADGVRFLDSVVPFGTPEADKIGARLESDDRDPESYALPSYAAVQAWAEGVKRAGTTDGIKVAEAMRSAPIDTVIGKLSWDKKGDIEQMRYVWFVWHNGEYAQEHDN